MQSFFLPIHPNVDDMKHSSWGCQHESFCSLIWAGAKTINWPHPLGWFKKFQKVILFYLNMFVCLFYMRWQDMKHSSWGCQHESFCSLIWAGAKTINWPHQLGWFKKLEKVRIIQFTMFVCLIWDDMTWNTHLEDVNMNLFAAWFELEQSQEQISHHYLYSEF